MPRASAEFGERGPYRSTRGFGSDISVARGTRTPPAARILGRMSETIFTPGADVLTPRGRGAIVDVRATPSGKFVFGVEDDNGEVRYFTEKALRLAQS